MGLTSKSTGKDALDQGVVVAKKHPDEKIIAIAGNPNVGKSTVFNNLTGMKQHTGNWAGKTVSIAQGRCQSENSSYIFVDIPGTYSLIAHSKEEEVARDFLETGEVDAVVVVCDATCLERNLNLVLQILEITDKAVLCLNLCDEAKRKHIEIDKEKLSEILGIPVVETVARKKSTLKNLLSELDRITQINSEAVIKERKNINDLLERSSEIAEICIKQRKNTYQGLDKNLDRIFTSRLTGFPIMLAFMLLIFWLTVNGANYPSELLSRIFGFGETKLNQLFNYLAVPPILTSILIDGAYKVLSWVVAVMLPPMAIFFPLFTLLEDSGYLPRIAYNLDRPFRYCNACGKQALTMCMGFGCNAAGVTGARIIDSPRERLLAILTNSFVPCNGKFPTLIAVITIFFVTGSGFISSVSSALVLTGIILLGIIMTFIMTKLLSMTLLKGMPSSVIFELPSYRRPQIAKVLVRSVFDRTLFVLGRAAAVAAPAGVIIWIFANVTVGGASLLTHAADFLDPFARLLGLDGVILIAFILGFPANEIVLPIMLMAYTATGTLSDTQSISSMHGILLANGWSAVTAINFMLFSLFHFPCSTTVLTIKKETGSMKWTLLSALLPTAVGVICCMTVNLIFKLI